MCYMKRMYKDAYSESYLRIRGEETNDRGRDGKPERTGQLVRSLLSQDIEGRQKRCTWPPHRSKDGTSRANQASRKGLLKK